MTANRPRPPIPDSVKLAVVMRQLNGKYFGEGGDCLTIKKKLAMGLKLLARFLGCERKDLRLDHDPALRIRDYNPRITNVAARYTPNANDPNHLIYRSSHDHHIKTNVRGDGAQFSDTVLIKRQRRREKASKPAAKVRRPKRQWPKGRKIESRGFR